MKLSKAKEIGQAIKDLHSQADLTPCEVKVNGKIHTKPKEIADKCVEYFENKIEDIRNDIQHKNFKAKNILKAKVKRVEEYAQLKPVKIS